MAQQLLLSGETVPFVFKYPLTRDQRMACVLKIKNAKVRDHLIACMLDERKGTLATTRA